MPSSQKLSQAAMKVTAVYRCLEKPSDAFMLADQTISSTPATRSSVHATADADVVVIVSLYYWLRESGKAVSVRPNVKDARDGWLARSVR